VTKPNVSQHKQKIQRCVILKVHYWTQSIGDSNRVRFQVLTAMGVRMSVFWAVALYSLVEVY
jgi:hypothetical protein